jgi:hypothetical protein
MSPDFRKFLIFMVSAGGYVLGAAALMKLSFWVAPDNQNRADDAFFSVAVSGPAGAVAAGWIFARLTRPRTGS